MNALPSGRAFPPFPAFLCAALLAAQAALAGDFSVSISFQDGGHALFQNTSGFSQQLKGNLSPDPGPGGLDSVLTFELLAPPDLTGGDLLLLDQTGTIREIVRFNSGTGSVVFYFLHPNDTHRSPHVFYDNIARLIKDEFGTTYTPKRGQPGYVGGAGGPVTYLFYHKIDWPVQTNPGGTFYSGGSGSSGGGAGGEPGTAAPSVRIPTEVPLALSDPPGQNVADPGSTLLLNAWAVIGLVWLRWRVTLSRRHARSK